MPFADLRQRLDQSRLYDQAMRVPLIVYALFLLFADAVAFLDVILAQPSLLSAPTFGVVMTLLARVCQWMFIALFAILPIFRLRPVAKANGILPRLAPFGAILLSPLFILLERASADLASNFISVTLSLVAGAVAIVSLSFLGCSFSIMPEARRLVTDGPYRMIRHPLYLSEITILLAMLMQYRSFAAAGLFVLISGVELLRGKYEEDVLARAFPEFEDYRRHTSFLLPHSPGRFFKLFFEDRAIRRRLALATACALGLLWLAMSLPKLL